MIPAEASDSTPEILERMVAPLEADLVRRLTPQQSETLAPRLFAAMQYAALGPGKRLRPALVVAAAEACGGTLDMALPAASAVELLHAYTLVHDDLPAMDDDDVRRGRPTVHIAFDEALAILAGDALLTAAFGALADLSTGVADAMRVLAARAGADQLLSGQAADVAVRVPEHLQALEQIHAAKTGALFSAAAELGAISAGADAERRKILAEIGLRAGIAFQYRDDFEDGEHAHLRVQMAARRHELAEQVSAQCERLGARALPLARLVGWIVGKD